MPIDYLISQINDLPLDFPFTSIGPGITLDWTDGADYEKLRTGNFRKRLNTKFYCIDTDKMIQLREMFANAAFDVVFLSGAGFFDGLYSRETTGAKKTGVPGVEEWTANFTWGQDKWVYTWNESPLATDWDTYEEWTSANPTWIDDSGPAYGWASSAMTLGHVSWVRCDDVLLSASDYDVQIDVKHSNAAGVMWFGFRQGGAVANNYWLVLDVSANTLSFRRYPGNEVIRSWSTTVAVDTYYTLRIRCIGDRFDIWLDGVCLTPKDEPIIDKLYPAGQISLYSDQATMTATNFIVKIGKPAHIPIPPGDYELNRYYESRQITSRGLNKLLVGPRSPVVFDERNVFPVDPSKRASFRFNEGDGTTLYDHSGFGNHLTITNCEWSSEKYSDLLPMCLKYTTTDSSRAWRDPCLTNSMDMTHELTIEVIWEPHSYTATGNCALTYSGTAANQAGVQWTLQYDPDSPGKPLYCYTSTGSSWITTAYINLVDYIDQKIHFVWTFSVKNGEMKAYINGQEQTWISGDSTPDAPMQANTQKLYAGTNWAGGHYIDTKIWLFELYQGAKDTTWVQERFAQLNLNRVANNEVRVMAVPKNSMADGYWENVACYIRMNEGAGGTIRDSGPLGTTITPVSIVDANWEDLLHPSFGKCLHLDGAADWFQFQPDGIMSANRGSIYGWAKLDDQPAGSNDYIFRHYDAVTSDSIRLYILNGGVNLLVQVGDTAIQDSTYDPIAGQWFFFCITWDSGAAVVYINGVLGKAWSYTGLDYLQGNMDIGSAGGGSLWDGSLDELVFLNNVALSATDVAWLYNNAPQVMDESLWRRVYAVDHEFEDQWMIVDNGQIRLLDFQEVSDTASHLGAWGPRFQVWNGYWDSTFRQLIRSGDQDTYIDSITLKEITPYYARWTVRATSATAGDTLWNFEIRAGIPGVWFQQTWLDPAYGGTYDNWAYIRIYGLEHQYERMRFLVSLNGATSEITDTAVQTGNETRVIGDDCFAISFSPERNFLNVHLFNDDYNTGLDDIVSQNALDYLYQRVAVDGTGTDLHAAIAVIPFDTSWLHTNITTGAGWSAGGGSTQWCAAFGSTVYVNTGATISTRTFNTGWRKGAYRLFIRWGSSDGTGDGNFATTGAIVEGATGTISNLATATTCGGGQWNYIDILADDNDSIIMTMQWIGGTDVRGGEVIIVPISLATCQGPLNVAHAALNPVTINRLTE